MALPCKKTYAERLFFALHCSYDKESTCTLALADNVERLWFICIKKFVYHHFSLISAANCRKFGQREFYTLIEV